MLLETMNIGMLGTDCYIIAAGPGEEAAVIDPAGDVKGIMASLERSGLRCTAILCTHGHSDHIAGVGPLSGMVSAPVYIHKDDAGALASTRTRVLGLMGGVIASKPETIRHLEDGQEIEIGKLTLKVLHTPGHTPGSVSFYTPGYLFCGDLIFQGSIGRTDLRGGSIDALMRSVKEKVWVLPADTEILPGHGPATSIAAEKRHNPFLRGLG
jgi:glyoxylase-like metal-dependent hydrolase (beta-lactamase superfamily II)